MVEHFLDTEGVRGSNPLSRTIPTKSRPRSFTQSSVLLSRRKGVCLGGPGKGTYANTGSDLLADCAADFSARCLRLRGAARGGPAIPPPPTEPDAATSAKPTRRVREPAVAGLFYPGDTAVLSKTLDTLLKDAPEHRIARLKGAGLPPCWLRVFREDRRHRLQDAGRARGANGHRHGA